MSRILGRIYDVYNTTKELEEAKLPKFKIDNRETSWKDIVTTPEKLEYYYSDKVKDFLLSKKVKLMKTPFAKYTLTQVPENEIEDRFIRFPSLTPKNEFKRELMFYMGMLLSSYRQDKDNIYEISSEYDDTLPLLMEYLYLKDANEENKFDVKHLYQLKKYQKSFLKFCKDYQDFEDFKREVNFASMDEKKYKKFQELCQEKEDEITSFTKDSVIQMSSYEGLLGIIDNVTSESDIKDLIEKLTLNEKESRASILKEYDIDSYGYKKLRKKIESYNKNK